MRVLLLMLAGCGGKASFDPVADAGPDQIVAPGAEVTLDGSGSADPDGEVVGWSWTFIEWPEGSGAELTLDGATASFVADLEGVYILGLQVTDDAGNRSSVDVVNVQAGALGEDLPPLAELRLAYTGVPQVGLPVTLDGGLSVDPEGAPLTYSFALAQVPPGSTAVIEYPGDGPVATFVPDLNGEYRFSLIVNDGVNDSLPDEELLVVGLEDNLPPVAACEGAGQVLLGTVAELDGTGSFDPEGAALSYFWVLESAPEGSGALVEPPDAAVTTLVPDVEGSYTVSLVVSDGVLQSEPCVVVVDGVLELDNEPPIADAGPDLSTDPGVEVLLDASGSSDPDDDPLSFTWTFVGVPAGSALDDSALLGADTVAVRFTPDVEGTYTLQVSACDWEPLCDTDEVVVTAGVGLNNPPVAVAGDDQAVTLGDTVLLDGTGSYDPDGDPITYRWAFDAVPPGSALVNSNITDRLTANASFLPDVEGTYELRLVVEDGTDTARDTLVITVGGTGLNTPPVADAGADQSVTLGDGVLLDGTGSYDPDGDPITYRWAFDAVPSGSVLVNSDIADRLTATGSFVPDVEGTYELRLVVEDGFDTVRDYVVITVLPAGVNTPPTADAGDDFTVALGATATADGSGSSDADGDPITYLWGFRSVPSGSTLTSKSISSRSGANPSFTPDVEGDYELKLTVSDGTDSALDYVVVTAATGAPNNAPVADAGEDQSGSVAATVSLDGTGSFDPDGDALTYRWSFSAVPTGSALVNSNISKRGTSKATFVPDVEGDYTLSLSVDDGTASDLDEAVITVGGGANTPPVADAGADTGGCALDEVTLDGSGSADADGDALSYSWTFSAVPSGSSITDADLSDPSASSPSFTPDVEGTYTLTLTVNDGTDSATDTVDVVFDSQDAALVLHMDEGSGTTLGDSGPNGLDGTGTVGAWTGARFFGGYTFDGGELVTIPHDAALALTSDWTIEFWMQATGNSTTYEMVFFKGPTNEYALYRYGGNVLYFYGRTSTSYATLNVTNANLDGDWHHYAITWNASHTVTIYEDGVALGSVSGRDPLVTGTDPLYLGNHPLYPTYYPFLGSLDELIVLGSALSASEVAARASSATQFCTEAEDTAAPTASITSPSGGSAADAVVKVEGTAADESAIVSVTVNGAEAVATSDNFGTWVAYVSLSDGSNSIVVEVEDIAGNVDTAADSITLSWSDTCYDGYAVVLPFDEDSGGSATDATGNGLDASESGTDRVVGVYGNAVVFDGSASATVPDDGSLSLSSAFTVDLWYARDGSTSDYELLLYKSDGSSVNYAVVAYLGFIGCGLVDASGSEVSAYASGFNDGDFHHVACTFDGSTLSLYVDGGLEGSAAAAGSATTTTADLSMGGFSGLYGFTGLLDGVRVQSAALSAAEVADLYTEGEMCAISDNLALGGTATASAQLSVNYGGSKVIDGDTSEDEYADQTYWLLPASRTGWVTVDLGNTVGITRVRWANTHHGPRYTAAAKDYTLVASATGDFTGEEVVLDSGTGDLETDLRFHQVDLSAPVTARYVRFEVDSFHSASGGINELQVFGLE